MGRPVGTRRWPWLVIGALAVVVVLSSVLSGFYVDLLWYRELQLSTVFWTVLRTKVFLGLVFGLLFFAILYVNLLIVRWITPTTRVLTPDQEVVERIRQNLEPYLRWLIPAGSALLALLVGIGVSRQWQLFALWRNSSGISFGDPDPLFGRDAAFYVFSLPWLRFVQGWLFSSLVGVTFIVGVAHFVWGGIRPQAPGLADKVAPPVRAHLSVLLGLIMLAKAWGYYLGRFDLLTSPRGVVEGASFTDVQAQLPALNLLAIVAVICAVLFLVNIRVRLWSLPVIAVGLLVLVSVLVGTAYPAFVQRFRVAPQEFQRERPYILDNIEGTRRAFGLDRIDVRAQPADELVTAEDVEQNEPTISNIRLWRPEILREDFQGLQRIKQYYEFPDVDVDRYELAGEQRVLMVSAREVSQDGVPEEAKTWQNEHLVYTHGFGAVAAQVNTATTEGAPIFTLRDIPPSGEPPLEQERVYFGEGLPGDSPFLLVNTGTPELDYEGSPDPQQYQGSGGIPIGNIVQRALFAWRFRDVNLLISGQISSDSRILINRDIERRTHLPASFLGFDADPYMAIVDGRMVWIWDAYTTTDEYPYSQEVDLALATDGAIEGGVNYIRNSVKVTVDAYDGTVTYYADLDADPIIQAWDRAFPGMFVSIDEASDALRAHFRYPENLFQVQAFQFANYHVTDPAVFYQNTDRWAIPNDPTVSANLPAAADVAPGTDGEPVPMRPYYLLMRLPEEPTESFVLFLPFVPQNRQNLVAWLAAKSDPEEYGELIAYELPELRNILGPDQVFSQINQDRTFSAERSLLSQGGSDVRFGDFLAIPLGNSFLYVQPVYVRSTQVNAIPELKRVLVVNAGTIGIGDDLSTALAQAIGEAPGPEEPPPPDGGPEQTVAELLAEALRHFEAADAALTDGNLALYQSELQQAQDLIERANELAAGTGAVASPSPTPSP